MSAPVGESNDPVNHPAHYTSDPSGIECIQITRHRNFNIGNAIKYLWRAGLKEGYGEGITALKIDKDKGPLVFTNSATRKQIEDLEKARWYIADEIKRLQGLS